MSDDKAMKDEFEDSVEDLKKNRNQLSLLFGSVSLGAEPRKPSGHS